LIFLINNIIEFNNKDDEIYNRQKFLKSGLIIQIRLLNTLFNVSPKINKTLNIIYLKRVSPCLRCKITNTYKEVCDVCFSSF